MAEAHEKEPEVVLIGDTHIQRLAQHEVFACFSLYSIYCILLVCYPHTWDKLS